jgi:hypothetical protein
MTARKSSQLGSPPPKEPGSEPLSPPQKGWKKYVTSIPGAITVSAAAIGAVVTVVPVVQSILHRPDSDVTMGIPVVTDGADFDIPLVNNGDRNARVLVARIVMRTSESIKAADLELSAPPDYQSLSEIGPKSQASTFGVIRTSFADIRQFVRDHEKALVACSVEISIVNFQSGNQKLEKNFNCSLFAGTIKTATAPGSR